MMGLTDLDQIKFEVKNIYEYYAHWIREGKLNVNSDCNEDLKIKFTVQDPCQIVRKFMNSASITAAVMG